MVERLGEMRKVEKEKETKRQFEVRDPPFIECSRYDPAM